MSLTGVAPGGSSYVDGKDDGGADYRRDDGTVSRPGEVDSQWWRRPTGNSESCQKAYRSGDVTICAAKWAKALRSQRRMTTAGLQHLS